MTLSSSVIRIITVDLSYRDTGVCYAELDDDLIIIDAFSIKNPKMEYGFNGLKKMSEGVSSTIETVDRLSFFKKPHAVIVEMPCFTQDGKSALCIGALWGAVKSEWTLVEPSLLKQWSGSIKGDGKTEVKKKVLERVNLDKKQKSNDNIVDSVGLALCFVDLINKL